jgi:hypothetical protein
VLSATGMKAQQQSIRLCSFPLSAGSTLLALTLARTIREER